MQHPETTKQAAVSALLESTESVREIAVRLGVSRETLTRWKRDAGMSEHRSIAKVQRMLPTLLHEGLPVLTMAQRFGVDPRTVQAEVDRLGLVRASIWVPQEREAAVREIALPSKEGRIFTGASYGQPHVYGIED